MSRRKTDWGKDQPLWSRSAMYIPDKTNVNTLKSSTVHHRHIGAGIRHMKSLWSNPHYRKTNRNARVPDRIEGVFSATASHTLVGNAPSGHYSTRGNRYDSFIVIESRKTELLMWNMGSTWIPKKGNLYCLNIIFDQRHLLCNWESWLRKYTLGDLPTQLHSQQCCYVQDL